MEPQDTSPRTPAPVAGEGGHNTGTRRSSWTSTVLLVLISVAIGAAGMWAIGKRSMVTPAAQETPATQNPHAAHQAPADAQATPGSDADTRRVYISPDRQQLIGVRTAVVTHEALDTTIRTVGVIAYDETRVAEVHTKIAGWADQVLVDFIGKQVRKGEPLFTIYSPDLVATQREYLLALKADRQLSTSPIEETRDGARSLLTATRERLRLWDVTDAQIEALTKSGEPRRTVTVYSPFTGIVLERKVFPGQYITPEMPTFKVVDLSTLWVHGQVFEYELGMLKLGQPAEIEFPYVQTTRRLSGQITFIYPDIDPQTRRARVRIEFRNPGLTFKPESFVNVVIKVSGGQQLAIPQEAVIDTGTEQYALLALPDGYFAPRPIKVGAAVNRFYPVLEGLQHGDRVVTSAQFLIDSETNLQAAMQSMAGHGHAPGGKSEKGPAAPPSPTTPSTDHSKHKQ